MNNVTDGQLAAIHNELKHITQDIKDIKDGMARKEDMERLRGEFTLVKYDHEERIRQVERHVERAGERQKLTTGVLAALTLIASSIAAWLGIQK